MAFIEWSDQKHSVNVKEIDAQHKKLVGMINQLYDAIREGKGKEVLGTILAEMADYAVEHFATEEKYFKKFNYSEAEAHIAEHKSFVQKVSDFKQDFDKGKVLLSIDILNFLRDWLINHISGSDRKYTKCFNENGLY